MRSFEILSKLAATALLTTACGGNIVKGVGAPLFGDLAKRSGQIDRRARRAAAFRQSSGRRARRGGRQ